VNYLQTRTGFSHADLIRFHKTKLSSATQLEGGPQDESGFGEKESRPDE